MKNSKQLFLICLLVLLSQDYVFSQEQFVGHIMSENERLTIPGYIKNVTKRGITDPPSSPVRAMAEWEEVGKLQVSWKYYGQTDIRDILIQIIDEVKDVCEVVIVCDNALVVQNVLTSASIDWSQNVTFIESGANSIWCRDYGANSVYINDVDSLALVDWIYNRPRPLDDQVPSILANYYNFPFFETNAAPNDLVNTGGNFMTDGMGLALCERLVLNENGPNNEWGTSNHSESEVDDIMFQYLGIDRYMKMDILPHDEIHHIDMHMKFLDEERILVGEFPEGVSDGPTIESNIEYINNNVLTSFGDTFEIIRIPMPPYQGNYHYSGNSIPYRTYTNALFVNSKILVPAYEEAYDTTAYRIWTEAKPGYDIVMINCNSIINYLGALHCITKEMGVEDPLLINVNQHLDVTTYMPDGYQILSRVKHKSGIASATLYYKIDNGEYMPISMSPDASCSDCFAANIPEISNGNIKYYVGALANSNKTQSYPLVAPAGYLEFNVENISSSIYNLADASIEVYPNPTSAFITINSDNYFKAIKVYDRAGHSVINKKSMRTNTYKMDVHSLPKGIYFVNILSDNFSLIKKIVIN